MPRLSDASAVQPAPADEVDRLYGLPLDEFTASRNQLVRRLSQDGRRGAAAEVAELRKPSVPAWAVNQLARERRAEMQELLRLADAIKAGDSSANERFREVIDELTRAARDLLSSAGKRATNAVLQDVATTLRTGAAEQPAELAAGRLQRELEASGFSPALAGARPAPGRASRKASDGERRRAKQDELKQAREALAAARAEARRARREADAAERESARLSREAEQAEERVADAERRLEKARGR